MGIPRGAVPRGVRGRYRAELEDRDLAGLERPDAVLVTVARNEPNHIDVLLQVLEERGRK